ncbi:MAG: quinone-dependent dihydroorotate dehydrogenase [Bacteroidia bacterium]|nr:quinone-dependent dihydroorotate dehydrogenase [Bacteroidia bacterium]
MDFYQDYIRPLLFQADAERVHNFTFNSLRFLSILSNRFKWFPDRDIPLKPVHLFGLSFPNPLGLAAGFDKNAVLLDFWQYLGFGFVEIGTVTPRPQVGNPKPRLFRITQDSAILNRMGFNNDGSTVIRKRLEKKSANFIIGVNIGKNKTTPNADAALDYCACIRELSEAADYFVVNVSSPNTPELRDLQTKEPLYRLLNEIQNQNTKLQNRPILVKIAPDLTENKLDDIIETIHKVRLSGIVVSNTTISRANLTAKEDVIQKLGSGGISGKPLTKIASERLVQVRERTSLGIIGVGGIFTPEDAQARIDGGANLIQLYTGFVYQGPSIIKEIIQYLY